VLTPATLIVGRTMLRTLWPLEPGEWLILLMAGLVVSLFFASLRLQDTDAKALAAKSNDAVQRAFEERHLVLCNAFAVAACPAALAAVNQRRRPRWWSPFAATFLGTIFLALMTAALLYKSTSLRDAMGAASTLCFLAAAVLFALALHRDRLQR